MKEVQPSFRVEWYKSCTLSFKLREKRGENSPKWYIEEVVHISRLQDGAELINESIWTEFQINKAKEGFFRFIYLKLSPYAFVYKFCTIL